jgi:prophage antirepressor-like protein
LDIFNHLLQVNENSILILFDDKQNIWFSLKDVIKSLGYVNVDNAINTITINEDYKIRYIKLRPSCAQEGLKTIHPQQIFINESGLYEVLSFSKKDLARQFMDKYFKEIMPKIRRTGQYTMNDKDKKNLDKLNKQIENYKAETTYYHNKYKFVPSENGYLYVNQNNSIKDGNEVKCFKIGYAKDMKERLSGYKVGNFKHKLLCYIPLDVNRRQIETCVKNKMKPHLLKLTTDTICYTTLKNLKEEILDCIDQIKTHICHCTICKKTYEFNKITTHKCNKIDKFIDVDKEINSIGSKASKGSEKGAKLAKASKGSEKGAKLAKASKGSKKGSKSPKNSKKGSKLAKSSKKGSKLAKSSKNSKKGYKLAKSSKSSKRSSKLAKTSKKVLKK